MAYGDWISRDGKLLLLEKTVRTLPYGFLSVAYSLYLQYLGFSIFQIGIVLTLTILSSSLYTFVISFVADRLGRRRTLVLFALTDLAAGALLFTSTAWWAPVLAGIVGNMIVGAGEAGPFLSLEQAMLPRTCEPNRRTLAFSLYNFVGYGALALGAGLASLASTPSPDHLRPFFLGYLLSGLVGAFLYSRLSRHVESERRATKRAVLSAKGRPIVYRLSALFAIDSFGGGFVGGNVLSLYFAHRFGLSLSSLGLVFFGAQVVTALSVFGAERIARRIGLLRTMVFSHAPSNLFLIAMAFAPTALVAVILLLCRQSLSQMDVPTRQSYVMAIVDDSDRTPAAGFTSTTRTVTSSISPSVAGYALQNLWLGTPLVAAGTLKLLYDALIYVKFRQMRPPEEKPRIEGVG
jgi:MFS family permease